MSPGLLLAALRARFGVVLLVLAATLLAAVVLSVLLPKSYRATASVLADTSREEQSLSNVLMPPQERIGYMQTQTDIITSERVARKVVRDLKLAENAKTRAAFLEQNEGRGSIEDWLVNALLRRLKVDTSRSSVIQVSYSSADPGFSAQVADAFAKAYIDTMLELRVQPMRQAATWFDEQLKSLRADLEDGQAKLTDYQRQHGILATDERYDDQNVRLTELSSQLVKAQEQALDLQTRERQARAFLARGTSYERLPDVLSNPYVQKLNGELLHGEVKLRELASQYGPNHPQYARQVSENRSLREKLEAEMRKVVAGIENSRHQSLQRVADLKAAIAAQRAHLLEMKERRNELTVLTRNVESAQRTYDAAMQRAVVSQVESRANQTNVALLSPAAVPRTPSFPNLPLNIAVAVAVGTMLGVALVILMELLDRRVRLPADLLEEREVPLIAVLDGRFPTGAPALAGRAARALPGPG